jgi:hypothetical protein
MTTHRRESDIDVLFGARDWTNLIRKRDNTRNIFAVDNMILNRKCTSQSWARPLGDILNLDINSKLVDDFETEPRLAATDSMPGNIYDMHIDRAKKETRIAQMHQKLKKKDKDRKKGINWVLTEEDLGMLGSVEGREVSLRTILGEVCEVGFEKGLYSGSDIGT